MQVRAQETSTQPDALHLCCPVCVQVWLNYRLRRKPVWLTRKQVGSIVERIGFMVSAVLHHLKCLPVGRELVMVGLVLAPADIMCASINDPVKGHFIGFIGGLCYEGGFA